MLSEQTNSLRGVHLSKNSFKQRCHVNELWKILKSSSLIFSPQLSINFQTSHVIHIFECSYQFKNYQG